MFNKYWLVNELCPVFMTPNEYTNELSFVTRGESKKDHHLEQFVCYYLFHPLLRNVCVNLETTL
jgi:hypothetical protein